jgi:hypothetical protein
MTAATLPPEIAAHTYPIVFKQPVNGEILFRKLEAAALFLWDDRAVHAKITKDADDFFETGGLEIIFDHWMIPKLSIWDPDSSNPSSTTFRILLGGAGINARQYYEEIILYTSKLSGGLGMWEPVDPNLYAWFDITLSRFATMTKQALFPHQ